jgi:hydroxymethylglutaryl-CoA lyase
VTWSGSSFGAGPRPPERIRLVEVGPRDGLQNEPISIATELKVAFVDALSRTGLTDIEVSSFVSSRWVPQLSDAEEVFRRITRVPGIRYWALVPNLAGLERAATAQVDGVAVFAAASETFSRRNTNASIAETLERFARVVDAAKMPVRGYVSTAFHCPFEGPIAPAEARRVALALLDLGCEEISLGDTIGRAQPDEVRALLELLLAEVPAERFALHCHDTFGQAVTNCLAAAELGITIFDASAGGLGGCPYAPGAPGNVATEALVRAFPGRTGVALDAVEHASRLLDVRGHASGTM